LDLVVVFPVNLLDISVVSVDLKNIPRKLSFLYRNPNYFFTVAIATSVLANMSAFPLHDLLFSAKSYIDFHWLQFILSLGSSICNIAGIFFLVVWLWTGLLGAATFRSSNNLILNILWNMIFVDQGNTNYYGFARSLETYIYFSCFFSNLLIISTPSLYSFTNLFDSNPLITFSAGIGFVFSCVGLLLPCIESAKSYFGFGDE
jgi:hypothetical protein